MKNTEKKPKYAMRKLSIGLVSCMLGFALIAQPSHSLADGGVDTDPASVEEGLEEKEEEKDSEPTNEIGVDNNQNEGNSDIEFSDNIDNEPVQAVAQEYTHKIVWGKDTGKYGKNYDKDLDGEKIKAQVALRLYAEDAQGKRVHLFAGFKEEDLVVGEDKVIDYSKYTFYDTNGWKKVNKEDYKNIGVEGLEWPVSDKTGNTMWSTYSGYNTGYTALYQNMNSEIEYKKTPGSLILEEDKNNLDIKYNIKKEDGKLVENEKREVIVEENDKFKEGEKKWLSHIGGPYKKKFDDRENSINLAIEQGYLEMYNPYTGKHNSYELLGSFKNEKHNKYYKLIIEGSDRRGWTVTLGSNLKEEKIPEDKKIDYGIEYVEDPNLYEGEEVVDREGRKGLVRDTLNHIYLLDKDGNKETVKKTLIKSEKISEIMNKIVRIGTRRPIPLDPNSFKNKEDEEEYNKLVGELTDEIEKEVEKSKENTNKENPSQENKDDKKEEKPSQEKTDDKKEEKPSVEKEKETDKKEENTDPKKVKKENKKSMSTPAKGKINPKTGVAGSGSIISILAGAALASLGLRKKND
uniref:G5 domain-containing protein n=1 Tax=Anaerococcus mediterraneensis TaxID=1870984 RepID=UPI0009316AE0|nr:G5 domain-containing protein [Anaerococcus mediterraneensis]